MKSSSLAVACIVLSYMSADLSAQDALETIFPSSNSSQQAEDVAYTNGPPPAPAVEEEVPLDLAYEIGNCTTQTCSATCSATCTETCCATCSPIWVNFSPYLWATQTRGTITIEGNTVPLNLDLSDLWDILKDGEVRGGFMGHVEFGRDDWSILINADIVSMAPSEEFKKLQVNTGLTLDVFEIGATRTIYSNDGSNNPATSDFSAQILGGVRYYDLSVEAEVTGGLPILPLPVVIDQADNWVDLFVGGRVITQLAPGLKGILRGDAAGFDIGTSSTITWNVQGTLVFDCNCEWADLLIGYRMLDIYQYKNGGEGSPRGFGVDNTIHGPIAGLSFQF